MNLDSNLFTSCLSIDLGKAFDSENHEILLSKLYKYGFTNQALNTINSYLTNRNQ